MTGGVEAAFSRFSQWAAYQCGRSYTFVAAIAVTMVWAATGPLFGYSDTWQLVINTGTTVVTWWMVFIIQNTQNRDTLELKLKMDELIQATQGARNNMIFLEDLTEDQLQRLKQRFEITYGRDRNTGMASSGTTTP